MLIHTCCLWSLRQFGHLTVFPPGFQDAPRSVATSLLNSTELCVCARGQLAERESQMLQRRETGSSQSGADHPNQGKKKQQPIGERIRSSEGSRAPSSQGCVQRPEHFNDIQDVWFKHTESSNYQLVNPNLSVFVLETSTWHICSGPNLNFHYTVRSEMSPPTGTKCR